MRQPRPLAFTFVFAIFLLRMIGAPPLSAEPSDQEILKILTTDQPRDRAVKKALEF